MQVKLPISEQSAELRDFVPHRIALAFKEESMRALTGETVEMLRRVPSKEELLAEFGEDVMAALDALPPGEHERRLDTLREEYLTRKVNVSGVDLGRVHEANMQKLVGMVLLLGQAHATRDMILDLPNEDAEFLLDEIEKIWSGQKKKASAARLS